MTALTRALPTLEERVLGSQLIMVGTVTDGPLSHVDYSSDPPQVHSLFRVAVEESLHGRASEPWVNVRVLGGQADQLQTDWSSTMSIGGRVLLFLAPYYGSDREEDTFVPYFRGCYPVPAAESVKFSPGETMTVDEIRSFVHAVLERREQLNAALPEREPQERDLSESDLSAMLHREPGGARWATLGGAEPPRSGG